LSLFPLENDVVPGRACVTKKTLMRAERHRGAGAIGPDAEIAADAARHCIAYYSAARSARSGTIPVTAGPQLPDDGRQVAAVRGTPDQNQHRPFIEGGLVSSFPE
jgi:hypothetical protein